MRDEKQPADQAQHHHPVEQVELIGPRHFSPRCGDYAVISMDRDLWRKGGITTRCS
jgi:hypothetical protein